MIIGINCLNELVKFSRCDLLKLARKQLFSICIGIDIVTKTETPDYIYTILLNSGRQL